MGKIEQSNMLSLLIGAVARDSGNFIGLDLRYDIADAMWDAGYRQQSEPMVPLSDLEASWRVGAAYLSRAEAAEKALGKATDSEGENR